MSERNITDRLFDELIQSAMSLSDDEVAAEYREDGEVLSDVAARVRDIFVMALTECNESEGQ